jgi:ABC-2 type transport system permease protein
MIHKILKVAQREYLDSVRTKTFILSLLLTPVLIAAIILINRKMPGMAANLPQPPLRKVQITDLTRQLLPNIRTLLEKHNQANPDHQIRLEEIPPGADPEWVMKDAKEQVRKGRLDVYIVLEADIVEASGHIRIYTQAKSNIADLRFVDGMETLLRRAVKQHRCEIMDISRESFAELDRYILCERFDVASAEGDKKVNESAMITKMMTPFIFLFMMFMGIFVVGQQVLTSLVEEKNSRIIEVLLSALTPFELMTGKILGLASIGLTVISIWSASIYIVGTWQGIHISIGWQIIPYFVIYYLLGFLLLTTILAGMGSICNTNKEAQSLLFPVTILFIFPMVTWFLLAQNPNGTLAIILSFIPPITPMIMILRIAATPDIPVLQIVASILLLLVSVPVVMWLAAKIFRTGILMYGKRPGLKEVLCWLRQS